MNERLHQLADNVAKANDTFFIKHPSVDTLMGIMDKTLRKQGMQADAITLDCITLNKKVVMLVHDNKPDVIEVALGNKAGEILSSSQYQSSDLCEQTIITIMEDYFIK
jgi:CTP:phosphocholine cytidylyltransferase-like protein